MAVFIGAELPVALNSALVVASPGALLGGIRYGVLAYVNRAYDAVASANVTWVTFGGNDLAAGKDYPGPGTFDPAAGGVDTSEHTVESVLDAALFSL